jgi:hypothetical protein
MCARGGSGIRTQQDFSFFFKKKPWLINGIGTTSTADGLSSLGGGRWCKGNGLVGRQPLPVPVPVSNPFLLFLVGAQEPWAPHGH